MIVKVGKLFVSRGLKNCFDLRKSLEPSVHFLMMLEGGAGSSGWFRSWSCKSAAGYDGGVHFDGSQEHRCSVQQRLFLSARRRRGWRGHKPYSKGRSQQQDAGLGSKLRVSFLLKSALENISASWVRIEVPKVRVRQLCDETFAVSRSPSEPILLIQTQVQVGLVWYALMLVATGDSDKISVILLARLQRQQAHLRL